MWYTDCMEHHVALVTGASSGIGRELARTLAAAGHDLVIVARRFERLTALAAELEREFGATILPVKIDLRQPTEIENLTRRLDQEGFVVDVLVNDAGLGRAGPFAQTSWTDTIAQLQVNIIALTQLTRLVLPGMIARGQGRILNVGSIAGYLPGPNMAVYHATKAFVFSFSEALSAETRDTGVTVTVLCPGLTHTEFHAVAQQHPGRLGWMNADEVARLGYEGMIRGQRVVNAGWQNRFIAFIVRLLPHRILLWGVRMNNRR